MSSPKAPSTPDPAKTFASGIKTYLKYSPQLLRAEEAARAQYDPQRIAEQQALQTQFGPTQYAQQLQALQQLDPTGTALRTQLGGTISDALGRGYLDPRQEAAYQQLSDLTSKAATQGGFTPEQALAYKTLAQSTTGGVLAGTRQTPEQLAQDVATVRAGQAARGNILSGAPAEALYAGQRGQQLLAQRQAASTQFLGLANPALQAQQARAQFYGMGSPVSQTLAQAGGFLGSGGPVSPALMGQQIQGVQADRASAYVNPNAGYLGQQFALQNYPNQTYAQQSAPNPWLGALSGAAGGAATGTMISPGYGTAAGAIIGGVGGYFSSERLKKNIVKVGEKNGLDIVEFRYRTPRSALFRGVIAEQVKQRYPNAVGERDGFLTVDYEQIGIPFEKKCLKCGQFKNINDFYVERRRIPRLSTHRSDCKVCAKTASHRWNTTHLDRKRIVNQRRRPKARIYERDRWYNDVRFKLISRLRWFLRHALKGHIKTNPAVELLGCSVEEFKAYLQARFKSGMAWNNYGEWHIDHIRPCSSFDLLDPEQQKRCFHYTNMQPMWAAENMRKGSKHALA